MRPFIFLVTLTFLSCSCNDLEQSNIRATDTLKPNISRPQHLDTLVKIDTDTISKAALTLYKVPNISFGKMILVSSGQMSPYTTIKIGSCYFDLVMSDNDTTYLATRDKRFRTPEGYKVGSAFSELPNDIQGELTKEPGWGYYCKLASGWTLGFCEGSSCTDSLPEYSSKVKWIFKRN